MNTIFKPLILVPLLVVISCTTSASPLISARQSLKNYALTRCLLEAKPEQSDLRDEVAVAGRSYHFMGNGKHIILQDEETLETIHDPYQTVADYMLSAQQENLMLMKSGDINIFGTCMNIYNSEAFELLIRSQDEFAYQ